MSVLDTYSSKQHLVFGSVAAAYLLLTLLQNWGECTKIIIEMYVCTIFVRHNTSCTAKVNSVVAPDADHQRYVEDK